MAAHDKRQAYPNQSSAIHRHSLSLFHPLNVRSQALSRWRSWLRVIVVVTFAGLVVACGGTPETESSSSTASGSQGSSSGGSGDTTRPTVTVTSPTNGAPYTSPSNTLNIAGVASDNIGITRVTWSNSLGGSGTASGTTSWSANGIALQQGQNIITVTAYDSAQNSGAISYIVYFGTMASNAYYVATTGSDSSGDGSNGNPWRTISYGIGRMSTGDTLIVKRGVYSGTANFISGIPSGTAGRYTTVMAEAPMEVRIQSAVATSTGQLTINSGYYIKVDGFIFDMANNGGLSHIGTIESGQFNKITRCIFKRSGPITQWGGLLIVGGSDNLVEDVAGVGACRYCFEQGGPDASTQRNIWRRVVGRFDYANSTLPKATFVTYGNNSNTNVRDHLYQNVIIIDGQNPILSGEQKYGGMYTAKNATNIRLQGNIVLNEGVGIVGLFNREWGTGNTVSHTVVWDLNGSSTGVGGVRANSADHLTIGGNIPGTAVDLTTGAATSSLIGTTPANLLSNSPGATIIKRYGVSGTLWGEPGYDQLTNDDLWPWPYEDKIKAVFAEQNNPPSGYSPSVNNTKRGFAADGNGLYGGPISLTSYIWEYLGTPCPTNVC